MRPVSVLVRRIADVPIPARQTVGSSGFDLAASTDCRIPARGFCTVRTGLEVEMPAGVEAQVRPRSGLASTHGIGVLNSPGTIDSDYRGEIKVVLFNMSARPYEVKSGDRIAQLVFSRPLAIEFKECVGLTDTGRGDGGFGHTG
ncbi:MAG: dUTP diphosphatase [candidate division WOR-3 bacterium]|nr:MAG: dUTP diphosphatase [candidate division WOR-3 bacterium]